ncbi:MAG: DUF1871 family protein [Lachnospiraceae bacterium]|nr:DUF1871 family protein [Lachnospiraceae bacterium]
MRGMKRYLALAGVGEMLKLIAEIINEWDPIGFFPMAPEDEYSIEIKRIYEQVSLTQNLQIPILAEMINRIFVEAFGEDVYHQNMEQCMLAAEKILKKEA